MEQNKLLDVLLDTFNTLKDQCKATSADLRSIKNELNRIFNDSECKEVIYTSNLDRMFFGIKVLPMIDADDIYDYLVDNESIYKRLIMMDSILEDDIKSTGYVVDTLEASFWCLLTNSSYEDTIVEAINLGQDTDTIACISGAMAGIIYGYDNIPNRWLEKLQQKDYLLNLFIKFEKVIENIEY